MKKTTDSRPNVKADTLVLYKLYRDFETLRAKDISNRLGCRESTAYRIIVLATDKARREGESFYNPDNLKVITVDMLFNLYGWDAQKIIKKAQLLIKEGKAL